MKPIETPCKLYFGDRLPDDNKPYEIRCDCSEEDKVGEAWCAGCGRSRCPGCGFHMCLDCCFDDDDG